MENAVFVPNSFDDDDGDDDNDKIIIDLFAAHANSSVSVQFSNFVLHYDVRKKLVKFSTDK